MSDFSVFVHQFEVNPVAAVEDLANKEWGRTVSLYNNLPADIKPAAQAVLTDAKVVMTDALSWAGTAAAAYIQSQSGNLATEVANIVSSALGAQGSLTSAASVDFVTAISKTLLGIVQHEVMSATSALVPQPVPLAQVS